VPVHAEMSLWNSVIIKNDTQIVRYHAYYQFDDTSVNGVGRWTPIPVILDYNVFALPYNLTYGAVDWCNFTIRNFEHEYNSDGNIVNTSTNIFNLYIDNPTATSGSQLITLYARDSMIADMDCHYTDVQSLYQESVLVGRFNTQTSSYECLGCTQYTLEELSDETLRNENITANQLGIYTSVQRIVGYNYQIWIIASWILKIGFVFIAIGLVFLGIYYFYNYIKEIERQI
jgi:hypothetical protein